MRDDMRSACRLSFGEAILLHQYSGGRVSGARIETTREMKK